MRTATIQIGNTDDKLTQVEWSDFCEEVRLLIGFYALKIHFQGGSDWDTPWQNACWVCEIDGGPTEQLENLLMNCREKYQQDSVAVTYGETVFV